MEKFLAEHIYFVILLASFAGWLIKSLVKPKIAQIEDIMTKTEFEQRCAGCRGANDKALSDGDKRFDTLSKGMAFILQVLPEICKAIEIPTETCARISEESKELIDELVTVPKGRIR